MRQFFFGALLLGGVSLVRAVNEFETNFPTYTKGTEKDLKWNNFASTDLKTLSLVAVTSKKRIPLTLDKCAESGKSQNTCTRWVNTGKFTYEGDNASVLLTTGSNYYFELEYVDKAPGTKTGTSKSMTFVVLDNSKSSSGSSSSKSKSKKKKGKLGTGGIIGIAVGIAIVLLLLAIYGIYVCCRKRKDKNATSKDMEEVEMGKQADPLMGQDGRVADTTAWSADVPNHAKPEGTEFPKYEPYKATTTTGQGAAADYYSDQPAKTSGNGAGPVGVDRL